MTGLLIRNAEIEGRCCDVRCRRDAVVEIGAALAREAREDVVDAGGGASFRGCTTIICTC